MIINTTWGVLITSILATIGFIAGAVALIVTNKSAKNKMNCKKIKTVYIVVGVLFLLISSVSWVMNYGMLREFYFILIICNLFLFLIANIISIFRIDESAGLRVLNTITYISFVLAHISLPDLDILPDTGDLSSYFLFFRMIYSDSLSRIMFIVSVLLFAVNSVLLIVQLVAASKVTKAIANQNTTDQPS